MNVCCNWNEQMLQYCSTVFNNRLLVLFFFSLPCLFNPSFLFIFSSVGSSFFAPRWTFSLLPLRLSHMQTLCSVLWLCWVTKWSPYKPWRRWTVNPTSRCRRDAMKWKCPTPARLTRARTAAPTTAPTPHAKPCPTTRTSYALPSAPTERDRATIASPSQVPRSGHAQAACIYLKIYISYTDAVLAHKWVLADI